MDISVVIEYVVSLRIWINVYLSDVLNNSFCYFKLLYLKAFELVRLFACQIWNRYQARQNL